MENIEGGVMKNMPKRTARKVERKVETQTIEPTPEPVYVEPMAPKPTLQEIVALFPDAEVVPTQRWYGETFYPKYTEALKLLKELAK